MCDGELILENSPLHQYLQEIGWDDSETVARADTPNARAAAPQLSTARAIIEYLQNLLSSGITLLKTLSCYFYSHIFSVFNPQVNLSDIQTQAEPHLLPHHKDSLEDLLTSGIIRHTSYPTRPQTQGKIFNQTLLYSIFLLILLLLGIFTNFSNVLVNTFILTSTSLLLYLSRTKQNSHTNTVSDYVITIRTFKQLSKVMLSHLRDCQIARTPYATGVTWSMLDNIEKQCSDVMLRGVTSSHVTSRGLQNVEMRGKLFEAVRTVFLEHKKVVEGWLDVAPLVSEIDCVNRYICLQDDIEILSEDGDSDATPRDVTSSRDVTSRDVTSRLSSHTLRYYLKLVEHVSSEVLWRLLVSTYPHAWPDSKLNNRGIQNMLTTLNNLNKTVSQRENELRVYYEKHNNPEIESAVLSPNTNTNTNTSTASLLHQLQLLHSSLNIATIRCRDTHSLLSQDLSATNISSSLSLIKLNIDLAEATLQTLTALTAETNSAKPNLPESGGAAEMMLEEGGGKEAVPIVPYRQQGNMVFSGVNDGADNQEVVGGLDSDDELELNLHRHKQESKLMLEELRHVIETNPTCLYEDDYEEFKRTGLLNPTKQDLKELFENRSDDESDTEQTELSDQQPQRIGFNPFSLPFPTHSSGAPNPFSTGMFPASLFNEIEVCEAYGDLSEDEEEGEVREGEKAEEIKVREGEKGEEAGEDFNIEPGASLDKLVDESGKCIDDHSIDVSEEGKIRDTTERVGVCE